MIKKIFFITYILISSLTFGQKPQKFAYIDMDYILENVPEYMDAQSRLNEKVKLWQKKLDNLSAEIETLQTSLINEKALLTNEMIDERKEDIDIKQKELKRLQLAYFGPNGDLYRLRKQFVRPVQDQVFNAIQDIAKRKKYDFVFDKSSDLIMLYSNNKYDISELVLNAIIKNRKKSTLAARKQQQKAKAAEKGKSVAESTEAEADTIDEAEAVEATDTELEAENDDDAIDELTDPEAIKKAEALKKQQEKEAKRAALKERIKQQQEAREKLRDSLKRVSEERRAAKLKEIEDRKRQRDSIINSKN